MDENGIIDKLLGDIFSTESSKEVPLRAPYSPDFLTPAEDVVNEPPVAPPTQMEQLEDKVKNQAMQALTTAGVKQDDEMFPSLLEMEMMYRMADIQGPDQQWENIAKTIRTEDVLAKYGKSAPAFIQALDLGYPGKERQTKKSKSALIADYMKQQRADQSARAKTDYQRSKDKIEKGYKDRREQRDVYKLLSGDEKSFFTPQDQFKQRLKELNAERAQLKKTEAANSIYMEQGQLKALADQIKKVQSKKAVVQNALKSGNKVSQELFDKTMEETKKIFGEY